MKSEAPILLSISMLVSGKKEEYLSRSLESLLYFKKAFPCEIILVDTGCSQEQRRFIAKYADLIVDFPWCDDFAAARNAGLKEARGRWFLYLDDDEWFENPKEIIAFFQAGEYERYNCASYVVRNYSNLQGTMYDDSYPSRMVKLTPETKFVGRIHEYLEPFELPKKTFRDFVHHYGYAYRNQEEREAHARRNIVPLQEMRKEHPGDPRWMCQLAQEYFSLNEYEEVIRVCREGLQEWRTLKAFVEYGPVHAGALYAYILASLESMERYGEEERWYQEAVREPVMRLDFMEPTMAFFCLAGARMYCYLGQYGRSRDLFRQYLGYYRKYKDDRTAVEAGAAALAAGVFQERSLYGTVLVCMEALIRTEDQGLAEEAFYLLDWSDPRLLQQNRWERAMLEACCSVAYQPLWIRILQTLVSRKEGMKEMLVVFLETEIAYQEHGEEEKLSRLYRLISELDYEHRYILTVRILWEARKRQAAEREDGCDGYSKEASGRRIEELFCRLFEEYTEEIPEVRNGVWDVAEKLEIPMEPLLLQTDAGRWSEGHIAWLETAGSAEIRRWENRLESWKTRPDVRYELSAIRCLEGYLRRFREVCADPSRLEGLLRSYSKEVLERRESLGTFLASEEVQLALNLEELRRYREQGDDRLTLEGVKNCLGVHAALDPAVLAYAEFLRDEAEQRNRQAEEERTELFRLVTALKEMARQQIESGNSEAAKEILSQIQAVLPEDQEVPELWRKLEEE